MRQKVGPDQGQLSRLVPVIRIMADGEEIHQRGLHGRNVQCAGEKENGKDQDRHHSLQMTDLYTPLESRVANESIRHHESYF